MELSLEGGVAGATYGRLDCAVNNSGGDLAGDLVDGSEADFDAMMAVSGLRTASTTSASTRSCRRCSCPT